jgi:hypothetical protein
LADQNNGWGHFYNPSTSAVTVDWTSTAAFGNWGNYTSAFKAAQATVVVNPNLTPSSDPGRFQPNMVAY